MADSGPAATDGSALNPTAPSPMAFVTASRVPGACALRAQIVQRRPHVGRARQPRATAPRKSAQAQGIRPANARVGGRLFKANTSAWASASSKYSGACTPWVEKASHSAEFPLRCRRTMKTTLTRCASQRRSGSAARRNRTIRPLGSCSFSPRLSLKTARRSRPRHCHHVH